MSTPDLYLQTLFSLDDHGRIIGTREPDESQGPLFSLIRGRSGCTWAVRSDVPRDVAMELDALAREEPPVSDFEMVLCMRINIWRWLKARSIPGQHLRFQRR